MGQVKYDRQDYAAALTFYKKIPARAGAPDWIRAWSLLKAGNCLVHLEQFQNAQEYFQKAAEFQGDDRGAIEAARRSLEQLRDHRSPR
jgi:tetratricopeptide (TPR) repeat protein